MGVLDGKVALITGGGGAMGKACAYAMAREGAAVALTGLVAADMAEAVAYIEGFGGKVLAIVADATREDDIVRSLDEAVAAFGGLDILVNNAVNKVFIAP